MKRPLDADESAVVVCLAEVSSRALSLSGTIVARAARDHQRFAASRLVEAISVAIESVEAIAAPNETPEDVALRRQCEKVKAGMRVRKKG